MHMRSTFVQQKTTVVHFCFGLYSNDKLYRYRYNLFQTWKKAKSWQSAIVLNIKAVSQSHVVIIIVIVVPTHNRYPSISLFTSQCVRCLGVLLLSVFPLPSSTHSQLLDGQNLWPPTNQSNLSQFWQILLHMQFKINDFFSSFAAIGRLCKKCKYTHISLNLGQSQTFCFSGQFSFQVTENVSFAIHMCDQILLWESVMSVTTVHIRDVVLSVAVQGCPMLTTARNAQSWKKKCKLKKLPVPQWTCSADLLTTHFEMHLLHWCVLYWCVLVIAERWLPENSKPQQCKNRPFLWKEKIWLQAEMNKSGFFWPPLFVKMDSIPSETFWHDFVRVCQNYD